MKWYNNMKLKFKFSIMTVVIAVLILVISFYCLFLLESASKKYNNLVINNKALIEKSIHTSSEIAKLRFAQLTLDGSQSPLALGQFEVAREYLKNPYETSRASLEDLKQSLESENTSSEDVVNKQEEIAVVEQLIQSIDTYYEKYLEHIDLHQQGVFHDADGKLTEYHKQHLEEVRTIANSMFGDVDSEEDGEVFTIISSSFSDMVDMINLTSEDAQQKATLASIISLVVMVVIILQVVVISKSITKPIINIMEAANQVANGNIDIDIRTNETNEMGVLSNSISDMTYTFQGILDDINKLAEEIDKGDIGYRINTDKYKGAFKEVTDSINNTVNELIQDTLDIIGMMNSMSSGNFDTKIKQYPGGKMLATQSLQEVQQVLKSVSYEINGLIDAANDGNLEYRIDSKNYQGDWKNTFESLNKFVENVVIPIKETQNALNQFAQGNFGHRITNEYKGEFNNIKQTVNYTAETIDSYISEISNILEEMSNKNFNVSIDREYLGDFKTIQKSVNLIIKNLNVLTKDIISSAEQVSAGAKQISESSISLAEGATEQAESVERLNNVIKLISDQTAENAKGANEANNLAIETKENASKGSEQMNNMLVAMEDINLASNSISNIIKVIDDIAFQTNILALNAAVEAARAGEHGKGFAVVAEEVRNLAARSQQAARETTELIESSVQKVEEGSKIANHTAESLLNIVNQIEDISKLVEACAKSSTEQEKSISEITESISQIASVTQNNTATSEESAAAAEELASQAEVFYASVGDFKLKQDNSIDIEY